MSKETKTDEVKGDKSIIDAKYRDKYRGNKDWLAQLIDKLVLDPVMREKPIKDDEGNVTGTEEVSTGKTRVNLDRLFALAEANHINVEKYRDQADRPNAPGRLRMTIGNMLRAAARHRHGLFDLESNWVDADADFLGDAERTHERDGTKIAKAKPEAEEADAA